MIKEIRMPAAGQTTDVAVIGQWCIKEGDAVKRGDVLLEVETDKAILPLESFAAGTVLQINYMEGDEVKAGDVLALVGDPGDVVAETSAKPEPKAVQAARTGDEPAVSADGDSEYIAILPDAQIAAPAKTETLVGSRVASTPQAMPNAKKLAREAGVDLSKVVPDNGAFIKINDVRESMNAMRDAPAERAAEAEASYRVVNMSRMRTIIGNRMLDSVRNIPVFTASIRIDMREAIQLKEYCQKHYEMRISFNDLIVKALAVTAKDAPLLNSRMENGELRVYYHTNVGIAVSVNDGLLVPVVKNADQLTLREIAAATRSNIENARSGKVLPSDMGCGSTTISNLGMLDISWFEAIANPPETSIFAVGKIEVSPVWNGSEFVPVPMMSVTGSFDHRVFDGADGAQALQFLKERLEHPALLMV